MNSLKLNKENIAQWKLEYDKELSFIYDCPFQEFSSVVPDSEWIKYCLDWTPHEAVLEELSHSDSNE